MKMGTNYLAILGVTTMTTCLLYTSYLPYFIVAKRIILNLYLFTNTANKLKNIESKIIHIDVYKRQLLLNVKNNPLQIAWSVKFIHSKGTFSGKE